MKYLKISNQGELDIRLIALMGGSTKTDDPTKIGQFGTGLKYAIAYLVRHEIPFHLFVGSKEVVFTTKEENIAGKEFKEIYCDGQSMNITTHYGYQWAAWEALREIYCNATDEGGIIKSTGISAIKGQPGRTCFYIHQAPAIQEVLNKWGDYFFKGEPLFEDETVAIYPNTGESLKLYKNGVLIQDSPYYKSIFVYDLKTAGLNELRQYQGYLSSDIANALLRANKEVIDLFLAAVADANMKEMYEVKLDWDYKTYKVAHLKKIFGGRIYLHPSSADGGKKSVKVNESLFNLLTKAGLMTEKISSKTGGWYGGGSGFSKSGKILYKEILSPDLQKRIQHILVKYASAMKYAIALPKDTDFEFVVAGDKVIFNAGMEVQNDEDLEASILIAILHVQESNMYKAFKRLIKYATGNRNFRKMLFGRNISDKTKPVYEPPVSKKGQNTQPYEELEEDFLPF